YMNTVLNRPDAATCLALAASGFRDFSRIAGSHPEMWRDIALANRDGLLEDLRAYRAELDSLITQLQHADAEGMTAKFERASKARSAWGKG
ncbi:MAG: prephenate dehydrogenase, partial [Chitinimonas sp.]|nr:prephenate dehydrogenase [Chitinimonas sp.]